MFLLCFSHLPCYGYIGEKQTRKKKQLFIFLVCFSHLPCYGYTGENRQEKKTPIYLSCLFFSYALLRLHWRKIDKKNTPIYLSCHFFSHLPCYGYIGEKQTRKMHLFIFHVCFFLICHLTAALERNRQEKNRYWWEKPTRKKGVGLKI